MATKHEEIGDVALQVGSYTTSGNETKRRNRGIGKLMRTEYDDGGRTYWLKLNAEALNPSLLILARAFMEKGDDRVLCSVFRNDRQAARPADRAASATQQDGDDIPF